MFTHVFKGGSETDIDMNETYSVRLLDCGSNVSQYVSFSRCHFSLDI